MSTSQVLQLIFIAIVFGISGLGWLFRKLREQQTLKRIEDERRRREEELLRTGRDPHAASPLEGALERRRQHETALRREAELQELRRRQSGGAPAPAGLPAGILIQIPGASSPIVVKPIPRGTRMTVPEPAPTPQRSARPARTRAQRPKRSSARKPEPPSSEAPARSVAKSPPIEAEPPAADVPPGLELARTPEEWRRAIIMRELLAPPLSDRPPGAARDPF